MKKPPPAEADEGNVPESEGSELLLAGRIVLRHGEILLLLQWLGVEDVDPHDAQLAALANGVAALVASDLAERGPVAVDRDTCPFGGTGNGEHFAREGLAVVPADEGVNRQVHADFAAIRAPDAGLVAEDGAGRYWAIRTGDVLDASEHADESDHAGLLGIGGAGSQLSFQFLDAGFEVGLGGDSHVRTGDSRAKEHSNAAERTSALLLSCNRKTPLSRSRVG